MTPNQRRLHIKTMLALAVLIILAAAPASAAPVMFEVETGASIFKYNDRTYSSGIPKFSDWTFDLQAGFEWAPDFMARRGWWLVAGFRYQALGESDISYMTFIDGPRVAIKWRGQLIGGDK